MGRIFKALVLLAVVGFLGLTAFAYFGNLAPVQTEISHPVMLDAK